MILLFGCSDSLSKLELRRAEKAHQAGKYEEAVKSYLSVLRRQPEKPISIQAAEAGVRVALYDAKNFSAAVMFYEYLVSFSPDEKKRRLAQEGLADTLLEKALDYIRAIQEYNKLLVLKNDAQKTIEYRQKLAKAYFSANQLFEALSEVNAALTLVEEQTEKKYDLLVFKGNILLNTRDVAEAAKVFENIAAIYPERARGEKILMNAVVCYEELNEFDRAISLLQQIREEYVDKEFIDLKMQRLKDRKANLPGARGLRK